MVSCPTVLVSPYEGTSPSSQTGKTTNCDVHVHDVFSSNKRRKQVLHSSKVQCTQRMGARVVQKKKNTKVTKRACSTPSQDLLHSWNACAGSCHKTVPTSQQASRPSSCRMCTSSVSSSCHPRTNDSSEMTPRTGGTLWQVSVRNSTVAQTH